MPARTATAFFVFKTVHLTRTLTHTYTLLHIYPAYSAGMVIPVDGSYMPHPRSASIFACPHANACRRGINGQANLQALQCANRRFPSLEELDPRPFAALQCAVGYTGESSSQHVVVTVHQ